MQGKEHAAGLSAGNRFTWADWLLFAVLGLFCFLSFSQSDLLVTGNRSWMLYRSHITDFYDVVYDWEQAYYANYMPSTFLLFAVWILPLKLLGVRAPAYVEENRLILVMWYKLLPVAAYMLSGFLLYKIARRMGFSAGRAKACAFSFLTMPAAFFSQFIFSQYDSFTVLFMLLGIYFYMRRQRHDTLRFCLSFGVALTFKYWALLIFLVLLLLDRKKLTAILVCSAVMAVPFLLECLIFSGADAFYQDVFGFRALSYAQQEDFSALGPVSFFQVGVCVMLAWAYFTEPRDREEHIRWGVYLCCGMCFVIFGLSFWHPQWILFAAPFWAVSSYMNRHTDKFLWLDILFIFFLYIFTVRYFVGNVDDTMLRYGVWKYLLDGLETVRHMECFVPNISMTIVGSMIFAVILIRFLFVHPRYTLTALSREDETYHMWLLRLRLVAGAAMFAVPAFLSAYDTVTRGVLPH